MALRTSEAAQCGCCESYFRLREIVGVQVVGDTVQAIEITDDSDSRYDDGYQSKWIGRCPNCGENVFVRNVT